MPPNSNILALNWKDTAHPEAGGAEYITQQILAGLVKKGYTVTLFCSYFNNAKKEEVKDGYTIVRQGTIYTVHAWAIWYWFKRFRHEHYSLIIDQIHGIPFCTPLYAKDIPIIAFIHEVAGNIWFKWLAWPYGYIGYFIERNLLALYRNKRFITVSNSTKTELTDLGIPNRTIAIIPETISLQPLLNLPTKEFAPTLIWIGRIAPVKQLEDAVEGFLESKKSIPTLQLWVIGSGQGAYAERLIRSLETIPDCSYRGAVSNEQKQTLLSRAHLLITTSYKEGYGLVTLEAASQGTPTVAYNVSGLRDAVIHNETGLLCTANPMQLAATILKTLKDPSLLQNLSRQALLHSKRFSVQRTVDEFEKIMQKAL